MRVPSACPVPHVNKVDSQDLTPALLLPLSLALVVPLLLSGPQATPVIVASEFIFERAPFRSAHASTVVETRDGLVAAWFGGTAERNPDVGIWVSRRDGTRWSAPVEVATGTGSDGTREPCWNPVLFQPSDGPLLLFYKVGP